MSGDATPADQLPSRINALGARLDAAKQRLSIGKTLDDFKLWVDGLRYVVLEADRISEAWAACLEKSKAGVEVSSEG